MKKFMALIVAAVCMLSLAGCGNQGKTDAIDSIKKDEVDAFIKAGYQACSLGKRILRSETAPLYMMSVIGYYCELKEGQ